MVAVLKDCEMRQSYGGQVGNLPDQFCGSAWRRPTDLWGGWGLTASDGRGSERLRRCVRVAEGRSGTCPTLELYFGGLFGCGVGLEI